MELTFSYKYANLLILLVGLIIILYLLSKHSAKKRVLRFGNFEVLEKVIGRKILGVGIVPIILRTIAFTLIVIAISDPVLIYGQYVANTDFVLAVDTSSSMLTPDYPPNRLEVAKEVAIDWVKELENTKIGIVTFAGKSYVKLQPTSETDIIVEKLKEISLESPAGTAIGEALVTSTALLADSKKNRTVILITDGRNNVGVPVNDSIKTLVSNHIRVIAIGIGSVENITITNATRPEGINENATIAEFPDLDEITLQNIANKTSGLYFKILNKTSFEEAMKAGLEYKKSTIRPVTYLLLLACAVLLIEWALEITKYRALP